MIIIKVMGGLGNQLFQYSLYLSLKEKNYEVYLDVTWFEKYKDRTWVRPLILNKAFNIEYDTLGKSELKKLFVYESIIIRILNKIPILNLIAKRIKSFKINYIQESNENNIYHFMLNGNTYLDGYWQNYNNFSFMNNKIRENLKFDFFNNNKLEKYKNKILNSNSIALHWRRGDYDLLNVLPEKYFYNAIKHFEKIFEIEKIFVFSDSIQEVKNIISSWELDLYFDFVTDNCEGILDYQEMYLMSLSKANIISNSTFSWWGAYLKKSNQDLVCYPAQKFTNKWATLALKEWQGINF